MFGLTNLKFRHFRINEPYFIFGLTDLQNNEPLEPGFGIYLSLILPYLNYGILAWGNTMSYQKNLNKFFLLQKKALRIVFNLHIHEHIQMLFFFFFYHKTLKLKDLYSFQLGQFMFNYNNNHLLKIFHDSLHRNSHVTHITIPRVDLMNSIFLYWDLRTVRAQNRFVYTGPGRLWKNLDNCLKESPISSSHLYTN